MALSRRHPGVDTESPDVDIVGRCLVRKTDSLRDTTKNIDIALYYTYLRSSTVPSKEQPERLRQAQDGQPALRNNAAFRKKLGIILQKEILL